MQTMIKNILFDRVDQYEYTTHQQTLWSSKVGVKMMVNYIGYFHIPIVWPSNFQFGASDKLTYYICMQTCCTFPMQYFIVSNDRPTSNPYHQCYTAQLAGVLWSIGV